MAATVSREILRNLRQVRLANIAMATLSSSNHHCVSISPPNKDGSIIYNKNTMQPYHRWYSTTSQPQEKEESPSQEETQTSNNNNNRMLLHMTQAAVDRVRLLREKKGGDESIQLRLQVGGGGCSGFQYVFELDSKGAQENDHVIDVDGVQLLCDDVSMKFVIGSTIDFESDLMMSKFVVSENPNAEIGCGCGSSFAVGDAIFPQ